MTPELEEAYRRAIYWVEAPDEWIALQADKRNPALDRLLAKEGAATWAFVTSDNPYSQQLSPAENATRRERLQKELPRTLPGFGVGRDESWAPERSFFVPGIDREAAMVLGRRHGQNAILFGTIGGAPELLAC
jgi:hypothetical protein